MENGTAQKRKITDYIGGDKLILLGAIAVVFILFTALNKNYFTMTNFINLLVAMSLVGLEIGRAHV